ncbi:MAG: tRNA dihydrouridine(20/20a) synthase DusA [Methylococcales bacterium]
MRSVLANPVSVAPMMERTDRHFRYLLRLISRRTLLYTEMITTGALIHGEYDRFVKFHPIEHPIAIQFGGSDPLELAKSAKIAADYGYDEINLNVGCPSGRVQKGRIGACLMAEPGLVAECVQALRSAVSIPVSVKTRIGIDHQDSYEFLAGFIEQVARAGCKKFAIHARKAVLNGLSPKANRTVPPLRYDRVFRVKKDYPDLEIVVNGGVDSLNQVSKFLDRVDGVMIGREAYKNPYLFASVDRLFYGDIRPEPSRIEVLQAYLPYIQDQLDKGIYLTSISRHLFGLFHARPESKKWRRTLSELTRRKPGDAGAVAAALATSNCF